MSYTAFSNCLYSKIRIPKSNFHRIPSYIINVWGINILNLFYFQLVTTSSFFGNSCERRTAHLLAYFLYVVRISTMLMMWKNQPLFGFGKKWYLNLCFVHSCNNIFLWIFYWIVMDLRTQLIKNDDVSTKMSLSIYQEARLKVDRHRTNKHIVIRRIFGTTEYDRMIQRRKFMILNTINKIYQTQI